MIAKINFKLIRTLALLHIVIVTNAQNVGINTTGATPSASAMLDISATNKGVLIPRVHLNSTTDIATIPNPATSLLVYNTNTSMTGGSVGFYYWNGTGWIKLNDGSGASITGLWATNGNNISNINTGHVGIGTAMPLTPLHIKGQQAITLPNGGIETSHVSALINDTTSASGTGSKIGLYSIVKNHAAANVGILAEAITKDYTNNFGIIGNIIGNGQTGGMAYAIGAVDAVKNGTGALYMDGLARYAGVPNTNEAGTVITNSGNGTMQWSKPVAFKAYKAVDDTIGLVIRPHRQIKYSYLDYDLTNSYDLNTGIFTAPVAGIYHFEYSVVCRNPTNQDASNISLSLSYRSIFRITGSEIYHQHRSANVPSGLLYDYNYFTIKGSVDVQLNAMDKVSVNGNYENAGIAFVDSFFPDAIFSGYLIR